MNSAADSRRRTLSALARFEWTKLTHRRLTWVPFIILTLVTILVVTVFHHLEFKHVRTLFQSFQLNFTRKEDFVNGYYLVAHSMNPVFQMLIPIFVTVAAGLAVAGEGEAGTLRACLIRPVSRRQFLLVKFGLLAGYALILSAFFQAIITAGGIWQFGAGNLYTLNVIFHNGQQGASTVPAAEVPWRLAQAGALAGAGMIVLAAGALLVSALVESAAMAYVLTLSIYFILLILRSFPALDWLYPYLLPTHMHRWQQCFYSYVKTGDIYVSLVHLACYLVAFLAAALLLFEERDIKS
jgi:ABC-2 type transport system permease protein